MTQSLGRARFIAFLLGAALAVSTARSASAQPVFYSLRTPVPLEFDVRFQLALATGDRDGAIAWAESLAAVDPSSSYILARIAQLHEDAGEDMAALSWGQRALEVDSLNADAAMLVGRMRLRSGEPALAAQILSPPLRLLGAQPELYALRALAHELDRNYEAALADLRRTDVLLPDFAWIATGILSLALEDGRLNEAYSALQLALELKPDDTRTLTLGVSLAERMGNRVLEETLLRQLALAPSARVEEISAYGAFLIRTGKTKEFDQLIRWADARGTRPSELRVGAGRALLAVGDASAALAAVKPVQDRSAADPIRARAHLGLGNERKALESYRPTFATRAVTREESLVVAYLEIRVGDRVRGIRVLEQVREGDLDNARQVLAASLCYSALGHPEEAVELIRESTSRGIASPSIYEQLGSSAMAVGDSLLAQWAFERLRDSGRETSECLYFLGSTELAQGDADRGVQTLAKAIDLNARNGRALLLLGKYRFQRSQLEMARDLFIRASQCPETATEANRMLARVCRSLRLDSEARAAESRARSGRPAPVSGLSYFPSR
ncbi:MAG: tetratricopeptide repeat protein [Candidatus Eiseniibacteriota bacterium]